MTKTAQPPTADQLREKAAELDRQVAEAHAALQQAAADEHERQWQALLDADRRLVETYSRAELDAAVDQALDHVKQTIADMPVTQALAAYQAAKREHKAQWSRGTAPPA